MAAVGETVTVRAVPVHPGRDDTDYIVECTSCGPLGTYNNGETDLECVQHLGEHGINVDAYHAEIERIKREGR